MLAWRDGIQFRQSKARVNNAHTWWRLAHSYLCYDLFSLRLENRSRGSLSFSTGNALHTWTINSPDLLRSTRCMEPAYLTAILHLGSVLGGEQLSLSEMVWSSFSPFPGLNSTPNWEFTTKALIRCSKWPPWMLISQGHGGVRKLHSCIWEMQITFYLFPPNHVILCNLVDLQNCYSKNAFGIGKLNKKNLGSCSNCVKRYHKVCRSNWKFSSTETRKEFFLHLASDTVAFLF